jgi:hypothetical protein
VACLKVTLVNPPTITTLETATKLGFKALLLDLAYMAVILEREDIDVTLLDTTVSDISHKELGEVLQRMHPDVIDITLTTLLHMILVKL